MSTLRQLRNSSIPWITIIVLACFSDAVGQKSYQITDLHTNSSKDNFSMAMGLNNRGWAENMDGTVNPPINNSGTSVSRGRAVINVDGLNIDLGTLGKPDGNSWINWGGINESGEATGMSETSTPDPDGEDVCGFGTQLTCVPFFWRNGHMTALPTVGGNNGQGSAINDRGEVAGYAETSVVDSGCPPYKITSAVMWKNGKALALPAAGGDLDGVAFGINNQGQTVGYSGSCIAATHAVVWTNNTAVVLQDLGGTRSNIAFVINNRGQIGGKVRSADDTHYVAALWQSDGTLTTHEPLPGDLDAFVTGINNRGIAVGNDFDPDFNWSHGFIWQNGVMTDLNTLISADSNLFIISASNINESGQISGMATVLAGPHKGDIHAYLAAPVEKEVGKSVADVVRTHPAVSLPANADKQMLHASGHCKLDR